MTWEMAVVLVVLGAAVILFVTEWISFDLTAVCVMAMLMATGVLTPVEGLSGLSNPATVTIAAMLAISAALQRTGILSDLSRAIRRLAQRSRHLALVAMLLLVGLISGFVNNTAVVAIFIPIMASLAPHLGAPPSRLLMPLSFVSIFGGVCTLVGTSTNLLVSSLATQHGAAPIGMFELLPVGAPLFVVGLAWALFAMPRLLPHRDDKDDDLTTRFQMADFVADVRLGHALTHAGQRLSDTALFDDLDLDLLEVFRDGRAIPQSARWRLRRGDVLRLKGSPQTIARLTTRDDITLTTPHTWEDADFARGEDELVEVVLAPDTGLVGRRLRDLDFPHRFGAWVLAGRASGRLRQLDLGQMRLRGGDSLLLKVDRDRVSELRRSRLFVLVSEVGLPRYRRDRLPWALGILSLVILAATTGLLPIVTAALLGLGALVLTGCITPEEVYDAITWRIVILLAGVIPLGLAMEKTGAARLLADAVLLPLGDLGPHATLAGLFLLTMLLTNVMSNVASAALLVPVAFEVAAALAIDARPLVMAVAYGASLAFMTPIGYQTNTLVYGPGNYRFTDFLRAGTPLSLVCALLVTLLVPLAWPF